MNFLEDFGKALVPKKIRPGLRLYLSKVGVQAVPYKLFGILFYVLVGVIAALYIVTNFFSIAETMANGSIFLTGLLVFLFWIVGLALLSLVVIAGIAFYINMAIYNRIKEIDVNLPDYLILVSTNLKGGLSFEKSLWSAIKPEFGVLSEEMSIVSKKVMTGSDLSESLKEFAEKYDSPSVKRTIDLILGEIQSGGQVAKVLDQTIDSLRKTRTIKDEMVANTLTFTIFISAIVVIISPLLFALAYNLLSILVGVSAQIAPALAETQGLPFKFNEIPLDKEDFKLFSVFALAIISICSAMIISIIQKGDIKGGIKYIPFFLVLSILFYFFFVTSLSGLLTMM
ncbi:MAG: type II secretion system F family protein [Candidatus Woesearchaeota archaeon]|jgi:pilus assembly protein TadC